MDLNEYASRKQGILSRLLAALAYVFLAFLRPAMSQRQWNNLIRAIYPTVKRFRDESTELARQFFDDNRADQLGDDSQFDIFKDDHYPVEWFEESMRPVYDMLQQEDADVNAAITDMSHRVTKTIEDGARRTLLRAVEEDEECLGWARYDPRPPTCAFCTMMISRGPVYKSAETAGGPSNESAAQLWRDGDFDALNELMNRWHPGCTCIVVPVYKYEDYPTQSQEDDAFELYKKARKKANSGKAKDILNAMRRMLRDPGEQDDETDLAA